MLKRFSAVVVTVICLSISALPAMATKKAPLDTAALKGVKNGKGFFDVNNGDPEALPLYLAVIKETYTGLKTQGVKPDLIVAFRGKAVKLVSIARANLDADQKDALKQSDALIKELAAMGVKFEVCAIATRLFGVENDSITPQVKLVGNTFISSIGYQSKGYAIIPIM